MSKQLKTNKITMTSLFEKIIRLEEKVDNISSSGKHTDHKFTRWAITITALEFLNLILHLSSKVGK